MNEQAKIETEEQDLVETENGHQSLTVQEPPTEDGIDSVIAIAGKMDAYAKAMDTITNHIIKRSFPGDWVCHSKETESMDDRRANIGSAAAERIASFIGIHERNWTPGVKVMSDDGKSYTWQFEADFGFGKRWIHATGRASSKDKFFGYAYGNWKELSDVKEDDVRMAAFRNTRKEGVRGLLGLRSIPISKLKELGYDTTKVRYANFTEKSKQLDTKDTVVKTETGLAERVITPMEVKPYPWSKPAEAGKPARSGIRYEVLDIEKVIWHLWANNENSKRVMAIMDAIETGKTVKVFFETRNTTKGTQYVISRVNELGADQ